VEVAAVTRRDLVDTISLVGSLAANESAELRAEVAGQVREILFTEGARVAKGDSLVRIDDAELRAQLAQVNARFDLAALNVARSENLGASQTIAQSEIDRARSEFAAVRAERSLLQTRLEKTTLRAPFDGVVGARNLSPGDFVSSATPITTLDDLSRLKVDFQVPERFLSQVAVGTAFIVHTRSAERAAPVRGEVYFVSSSIDRSTRSFEVKGLLADPPAEFRPGMFASIELVLEVRRQVLTVPEGAILTTPAGSQVVAVRSKSGEGGAPTAEFVPVALGMRTCGLVEIEPLKAELADGTPVVAAGVGALILFPGAPLAPRPVREEFRIGD